MDRNRLHYPDTLPITAWRDEIVAAIRANQVVVVAGETGSGKSTQLPKFCLEAGFAAPGSPDRSARPLMIGHTQPRRVAARTIAERVAEELGTRLGDEVGYAVRFTDTVSDATLVKVMTDGILLAEVQRDRDLRRYDALIIDEAHERSLNIDFLLGYLKQLLPRRPDLRVIVTSATIDTERFAAHFAGPDGAPAPVIEVSGRTYPVEVRYRPYGPDAERDPDDAAVDATPDDDPGPDRTTTARDDRDQVQAIVDACDELAIEGPGDILVFCSGEREIHDAADAIRALNWPRTEVLPLYARLSAQEQHRIFEPHAGRRIVLSTNVAETSITVPGVRYVVDTGTARISRYSRRLKVQRLPIEPVSQASANQRAGRCGRVAPGICIRLYSERDFEQRPEFTEPEILRTNLASVILQMAAIGLGEVAAFPFVEPPDSRAIRDGEVLLTELGAIRGPGVRLTKRGRQLARLPVDPRLGRMILEAERHHCVREVLVVAAGLSIRDVRERPNEHRERAAELHNRFRVPGSDLLSMVKLWDHLREQQRQLSGNRFRRMCRDEFLNYVRVREWMDLYSQLRRVAGELGIRPTTTDAHPDNVHRALLAGLLSHVGVRDGARRDFRGARQSQFVIAPGSVLARRPPEWVMAAELVETSQLFARQVAAIDPAWAEQAGAHLVKRAYGEPRWDERDGRAVTTEQVTLYGLPLVTDRIVGLDRVDAELARAMFITKALVDGEVDAAWRDRQRFVAHNTEYRRRLASLAARARRTALLTADDLYEFFDARVPDDVTSIRHFDRWWKQVRQDRPDLLDLDDHVVEAHGVSLADFPDVWRQGELELPMTYRDAPGEPLDGATVHVPLTALNQVRDEGFDWHIPGRRRELVEAVVGALPKQIRRALIPLSESVEAVISELPRAVAPQTAPSARLVDALAPLVSARAGSSVSANELAAATTALEPDLRVNFVVSDDDGEVHAVGTDLTDIKQRLAPRVRASIAAAAPIAERRGITDWDLGELPRTVSGAASAAGSTSGRGLDVIAYPTLLDVGDSVSLRVVTSPDLQRRAMWAGVRRLLILNAAPSRTAVERLITDAGRLVIAKGDIALTALVDDCVAAAVDAVMVGHGRLPWNRVEFDELRTRVRTEAPSRAANGLARAARVVAASVDAQAKLATLRAPGMRRTVDDANAHLGRLVRAGFVLHAGLNRLEDIERYVRGISYRLDHLAGGLDRDERRMDEVLPLERQYAAAVDNLGAGREAGGGELAEIGWMLEELRISVFAQPLGVKGPVSAKRIRRSLAAN